MTDALALTNAAPPYSNEVEQALIGAVLTNANWHAIVATFLKPHHFYILRHQYIWAACERIHARALAMDYLTVTEELRSAGQLDDVGGGFYLLQCVNNTPSSVNAESYGKMILAHWLRREMLTAADIIRNVASNGEFDIEQARAEMARQTANVMEVELDKRERTLADIALERQQFIEERMKNPNLILGIPTGLKALDGILAGWQRSDLIILAAVPGMGKTSLMLSALLYAAKLGKRVGFVSQEMGAAQIWDRLMALESGFDLQAIRTGNLNGDEYRRYMKSSLRVKDMPIYIHDGTVTPMALRAKALRWASQRGLDLLMLDYLQIMSSGNAFKPSQRAQEVGYFARSSKALAKELNIPMIAAAQLNREVQGVPELRHLRDSGEIEQEADVVTFIHRPEYYDPAGATPGQADLIIAKQRNGPTGTVSVYFEKTTTQFRDASIRNIDMSTGEINGH